MSIPRLSTSRLIMRAPEERDIDWFFRLRSDPEFMQYMHRPLMTKRQDSIDHLNNIKERAEKGEGTQWILENKDMGIQVGYAGIWRVDRPNKTGELGYGLDPKHHGQGYMQEALKRCVQFGFEEMDLYRLEAWMETNNIASARQMEALGAQREGCFRSASYFNEQFSDLFAYSLLKPEWEKG